MKIPITRPVFDEDDFEAVTKPLRTGWLVQGPEVEAFERRFAEFSGAGHAVACTSCTTALHLALAALGTGPGDEVVVPAFTFIASANAVEYRGARPVFCDVDLDTFNASAERMARALGRRTKVLMPVHLFGLAAEMDPILALARDRGLAVVEDAACGLGTRYRGRHVGTLGDFGCFSFHPRKAVTTGEGGMVATGSAEHAAQLRSLRDHGAARSDKDRHSSRGGFLLSAFDRLGYNYRMTDIQGALGATQMAKAAGIIERRRARARRYDELFRGLDWLRRPSPADGHSYQSYVCLFRPVEPTLANLPRLRSQRDSLMGILEAEGIATRQGTQAVHATDFYRKKYGLRPEDFPNALIAESASIAFPLYAQMTDEEQDHVARRLQAAFEQTLCAA